MIDFVIENGILKRCTVSDESCARVVVPDCVSEISSHAFSGSEIASVVIPATVKRVCEKAFDGCGALALADIAAEEVCAVPALVLILRDGVKRLCASSEKTRAFSEICGANGAPVIKGGARFLPIAAVADSVCEIGENFFCDMASAAASDGSFAAGYAKENRLPLVELNSALEGQLSDFARNISAAEKEAAAYRRDLEAARTSLEALRTAEADRLAAVKDELLSENERLSRELEEVTAEAEEISREISALRKELSGTFALAAKKKNELKEQIAEAEARLDAKRLRINTLPVKIHANEVEIENPLENSRIAQPEKRVEKLLAGMEHNLRMKSLLEQRAAIVQGQLDAL